MSMSTAGIGHQKTPARSLLEPTFPKTPLPATNKEKKSQEGKSEGSSCRISVPWNPQEDINSTKPNIRTEGDTLASDVEKNQV